jgi:hypothetical protein
MKNQIEKSKQTRQSRRGSRRRTSQVALAEFVRGLPRWASLMARQAMRRGFRRSKAPTAPELPCNQLHYHAD